MAWIDFALGVAVGVCMYVLLNDWYAKRKRRKAEEAVRKAFRHIRNEE